MNAYLRNGAIVLALLGSVGFAAAQQPTSPQRPGMTSQQQVQLTPQQRQAVYQMVMKEKSAAPAPSGISLRIGAKVPATVQLSELPDNVAAQMPNLRQFKYIVAQNQIALVDPSTNEIVEILRQ
jgi:hypothetical protein